MPRRHGIILVAPVVLLVAASAVAPAWVQGVGLDFWNLGTIEADHRRADATRENMETVHDLLRRKVEATHQVVDQLIAGGVAFAAALDQLEEINRGRFGFEVGVRTRHPEVRSYRELTARHALDLVPDHLESDPSRAAEVLPRLSAAFHAEFPDAAPLDFDP